MPETILFILGALTGALPLLLICLRLLSTQKHLLDRIQAPREAAENAAAVGLSRNLPPDPTPPRRVVRSRGGVVRVPIRDEDED